MLQYMTYLIKKCNKNESNSFR